ncbi:GNAT family N-acetyltransferase [Erwiniaceae bacterium BAC15a-03b]|uniref:GNAT family N-acetyltransferase n=1 Tax=Winslowiella arboricola TaxID=2978220 RepID=A0A9J6PEU9_9GAMM|nr:GNAT family N-acetyltransferase [Winslowiella arboricola]MCU5774250.1 GNAT family N-acetyltransferase [Winslowiella arboricola]MCU5776817.1 GNAT family N-acetyltransferase [Winslowiella arboricola]
MEIISVRERPEVADAAIAYFQQKWASKETMMMYHDAITHAIDAENPLPQWFLLMEKQECIGCAGLITNDFISRGELYPWLCALFIEEKYRGQGYARRLIQHVAQQTKLLGFKKLHLCTDLDGFYERYNFVFDGSGYHPWGETSRVYTLEL